MEKSPENKIVVKRLNAQYQPAERYLALVFLESSVRLYKGKELPNYEKMSEMLGIPAGTLKHWWANRDEIRRSAETLLHELPNAAASLMSQEVPKIIAAIAKKGYEKLPVRDLMMLLQRYVQLPRLITGQSTGNIAHQHYISPVIPGSAGSVGNQNKKEIVQRQRNSTTVDVEKSTK